MKKRLWAINIFLWLTGGTRNLLSTQLLKRLKKQSDRDESAVARDVSADTERCVLERIQRHLIESFDWVNTRLRFVWRSLHAYTYHRGTSGTNMPERLPVVHGEVKFMITIGTELIIQVM